MNVFDLSHQLTFVTNSHSAANKDKEVKCVKYLSSTDQYIFKPIAFVTIGNQTNDLIYIDFFVKSKNYTWNY